MNVCGTLLPALCSLTLASPVLGQSEFPQKDGWSRVTPSVVWCGDPSSTVTIEFHVVGRTDVLAIQLDDWNGHLITLYDDRTHGDAVAGDNVFTAAGVELLCRSYNLTYGEAVGRWVGFLRVTLKDGRQLSNNYGVSAGLVSTRFRTAFTPRDLGNGLSATDYAFFIDDRRHEVIDGYPVANVVCGKENVEAYRKLYSVFPDLFDVAIVTPGLQIVRPGDLAENVPYEVPVASPASHIGVSAPGYGPSRFGSAGRLKSVVYESFGDIQIFDHEIAHTWGANIGASLGLTGPFGDPHWNALADMEGQLGAYYFSSDGKVGHFAYNGDGTWRLIPNYENERYSPLELYIMGLVPPEAVPPVHILSEPDMRNLNRITAASVRTVTIQDIVAAEGGVRTPASADAQKRFNVAYIVTQDGPFNDAAYAFFSILSKQLMTRDGAERNDMYAPFYWATRGLASLNTQFSAMTTSTTPGAPTNLRATTDGATVTLAWSAPTSGIPDSYYIEAGSASGASDLAHFSTGDGLTTFSVRNVGAGTYYIRVSAQNAAGQSGPSNEVVVVVGPAPCAGSLPAPNSFAVAVAGSTVLLTWNAVAGASSYVIEAGSSPGGANLANSDTGNTATTFTASNVGPGNYYVRVRAKNGCGVSEPSNEALATVR